MYQIYIELEKRYKSFYMKANEINNKVVDRPTAILYIPI